MNNGLRIRGRRFLLGGFTLTELMVVVGIMTVINLLIFANYPEFSQRLALKRTSEDVALVVRQAQAYSLGIKIPLGATDDKDYSGFGVRFDKGNKKSLILFADQVGGTDNVYDKSDGCGFSSTECFQEYKITTGDVVSDLRACVNETICSEDTQTLDIFYPRASPKAKITAINTSKIFTTDYSWAEITIKSPKKKTRIIKVWVSGQVSIKDGL